MKKLNMKKMLRIAAIVFVLLVIAGGIYYFFSIQAAKAPYTIDKSKLTADYLKAKDTDGDYKLVKIEGQTIVNPLTTPLGDVVAFYTTDGKPKDDGTESSIVVSKGETNLKNIVDSISKNSCTSKNQTSGTAMNITYYKIDCGNARYYLYKVDDAFVVFSTDEGENALINLITNY